MRTINNNSKITILYVNNKVQQTIQMVTNEHFALVKSNFDTYTQLKQKEQAWYAKNNKIKLSFDEVVECSPLAISILGLKENQEGVMQLPKEQGYKHPVKIIKVFN